MDYREEIIKTYEDTLRSYSVSEVFIRNLVTAFITGFDAGTLIDSDESVKEKMINNLFGDEVVN